MLYMGKHTPTINHVSFTISMTVRNEGFTEMILFTEVWKVFIYIDSEEIAGL